MDEKKRKVILAADHAGFDLKESLKPILDENEIEYEDVSPEFERDDDYPDHAFKGARRVVRENARGVFVCGSGMGMCIAANKVKGIRAVRAFDEKTARMGRQEDDSNVLCIGARLTDEETAKKMLKAWLTSRFLEGRHTRRVEKIKEFEK